MKTVVPLPELPPTSALGFGCASLGGRVSAADGLRALAIAWDTGVRYFDTARSYGYGESERLLGRFVRTRARDRVVVATKAGILAGRPTLPRRAAKAAARAVFDLAPGLRAALRPSLGRQHQAGHFAPGEVVASAEASLRELGCGHLDLLMLHDAPRAVAFDDDVLASLESLRDRGLVRAFGLSTSAEVAAEALAAGRPFRAIQLTYHLGDQRGDAVARARGERPLLAVANQPFGGGAHAATLGARLRALAPSEPELADRLLGTPGPALVADVALNAVLTSPLAPIAVTAATDPTHLHDNARAVTHPRFTPAEYARLRVRLAPG